MYDIFIPIALMLSLGFAMTRITKWLKLPNVTAYILTGILIGPYCLNWIPAEVIEGTDFLADMALAFIAFGVGEFFKISALKRNGWKVIVITLWEACLASVLVFLLTYCVLGLNLAFSVVLAALASATAPASTMMTIRQLDAKGDFVDTLLQVVALDDVVSLVAYSIAISLAVSSLSGSGAESGLWLVLKPILVNLGAMLLGGVFGVLLQLLMTKKRTTDNRLIISLAVLFAFCGICAMLDVSPLLGCMSMGMAYINVGGDDKLFKQLNYFSPPILLLFFVRSGMNFQLDSLVSQSNHIGSFSLLGVGVLYFVIRIAGKYLGAYIGCLCVGKPREVRNYLGLALVPQAGVAIGLAALCVRSLGPEIGGDLQTIIMASSVLYEMIGPACAKLSLYLSKSYTNPWEEAAAVPEVNEAGEPRPPVEVLLEQLQKIQEELPPSNLTYLSEEELAFTQAAEEQYEAIGQLRNRRFLNRR